MTRIILPLTVWLLLTADLRWPNLLFGLGVSLLLRRRGPVVEPWREWLRMLGQALLAVPRAYAEAFRMLRRPHRRERFVRQPVPGHRSPLLVFVDIFVITFTPTTIVTEHGEDGTYEIHTLEAEEEVP